MKGIIFNMFNDIIVTCSGERTREEMPEKARGSGGAHSSPGNYDDHDMSALVSAASDHMDTTSKTCFQWPGREMLERFSTAFFMFRSFSNITCPEVVSFHPGAIGPSFHYHEVSSDSILMAYCPARGICSLAHGLMQGCSNNFNEAVELDHIQRRHCGNEHYHFRITTR